MADGLGEQAHGGTVARGLRIEPAHRRYATAARPVLHDDVGIARDEFAHVVGGEPRIEVVGAAGRMAEHNRDRLALIEIIGSRSRCRAGDGKPRKHKGRPNPIDPVHCVLHRDFGASHSGRACPIKGGTLTHP